MTTWPTTLPAAPLLENFQELLPDTTVRTDMEQGPAKIRRRTTAAVSLLMVNYLLSKAQTAILDTFYQTALLGGAGAFSFTHPRTGSTVSCRFTQPPQYTTTNGDYFKAVFTLEVLP